MGAFGGLTLTNKGKILQSKAQTGITLQYTRIAMGDGQLGSTPILALNGLIREKKSLNISKLKIQSGGKAIVGTTWSNNDLSEGFYFREIGVFANDPDEGEILYCYGNSGALAEYIPPGSGSDIIERNLDIVTVVGNASNVTATIDSSLTFASQQDLEVIEQHVIENSNNLMQLQNEFTAHSADYVKHPAIATTTNVGNAYSVTLTPAPISYVDGMGLVLTVNSSSTGATTINVNGLGAVPIKKANGNDVTNLKANGVYTLRYSSGNFILQGEGGGGTAVASDLLSGKTAVSDAGDLLGTMPNIGAVTLAPNQSNQVIPKGYHNGNGRVPAVTFDATKVLTGTSIAGKAGTMPNRGSIGTVTPGRSNKSYGAGYYNAFAVAGDPELISSNIKSGINIFGVMGTLTVESLGGRPYATGNVLRSTNTIIAVRNLAFKPVIIILQRYTPDNPGLSYAQYGAYAETSVMGPSIYDINFYRLNDAYTYDSFVVYNNGFDASVSAYGSDVYFYYIAIG